MKGSKINTGRGDGEGQARAPSVAAQGDVQQAPQGDVLFRG